MNRAKILLVDTDPDLLRDYSRILQSETYEVLQASTSEECLRIAQEEHPDLILLDAVLPDLSGPDICVHIKSDREMAGILVLLISGVKTLDDSHEEGVDSGADGYLTKPIRPRELLAQVQMLLRIKHAERALRESEERYRLLAESISDYAIFLLDAEGRIASWNEGARHIFGYREAEIIGQPGSLIFTPEDLERGEDEKELKKAIAEERAEDERWHIRKDGTRFWSSGVLTSLQDGNLRGFVKVLRDETGRKRAEDRLHFLYDTASNLLNSDKPQEIIAKIFEKLSSHLGLEIYFNYLVDEDGSSLYLDSYAGVSRELAQEFERLEFGQAICGTVAASRDRMIAEGIQQSADPRAKFVRALGIEAYACYPLIAQGHLIGTLSFGTRRQSKFEHSEVELMQTVANHVAVAIDRARLIAKLEKDIAQRKWSEEALRESELHFRAVFDHALDAMLITDDNGIYIDANPAACALFGMTKEELLKHRIFDFVESGRELENQAAWREFLDQGEQKGQFSLYRPDGTTRELEYSAKANFLPHRHLAVLRVVTERIRAEEALRKAHDELEIRVQERTAELTRSNQLLQAEIAQRQQIENALRESEERWQIISELTSDYSYAFQIEPSGRIVRRWTTGAFTRITGFKPEEVDALGWENFPHPDDRAFLVARMEALLAGRPHEQEFRVLTKSGETRWLCDRVRPILDTAGSDALQVYGAAQDITERKRAEEALRESEERYRHIVETAQEGIWLLDAQARTSFVNWRLSEMLGYTEEEMIGRSIFNFIDDEARATAEQGFQICQHGMGRQHDLRFRRKDGTALWAIVACNPIFTKSGQFDGVLGMLTDITERKKAEQEKLQLLRRLITVQEEERQRIARELHDQMGQYLAAIMMGLKSLQIPSHPPRRTSDHRFMEVQELTSQFAQQMRHLTLELRPTVLDDLGLHAALANYVEQWSERYGIPVDFHSNGLLNQRLPSHIETTIYRIVQEALTNVHKHAEAERVSILLEYRNHRVTAIVEDNGKGFDIETALNAPIAERRLGLLGMRERAVLVGGTLEIESTPGAGTTIVVRIPTPPHEPGR